MFFVTSEVVQIMGVKWKTTKNVFPKVVDTAETISGRKVQVGALTGNNAWL